MSLPEFPTLTREEAINQIISSIAMEELALSHIINAEGEKLQYILGTIPGSTGPQPTVEQVLEVNESVRSMLSSAGDVQTALRAKLQAALSASVMQGPTGPPGEPGIVEANSFSAAVIDGIDMIGPGENIIFNRRLYDGGVDIAYDDTTGIFTINQADKYSFYTINFWFYSDGYGDTMPYTITLYVNDEPYTTLTVPYTETQITSNAVIPAGTGNPITFYISNSSVETFSMPDSGTQAKITIVGFKS